MDKFIVEKALKCKLVSSGYESTGHGAFGEPEGYSYKCVYVNSKEIRVSKNMYIIHDEKNVIEVGYIDMLETSMRKLLDEKYDNTLREERYEKYLKLHKEFGSDPSVKRDFKINDIIE